MRNLIVLISSLATCSNALILKPRTSVKPSKHNAVKVAELNERVASAKAETPRRERHPVSHKRWGIDNKHDEEYWFDSRIHSVGNVGLGGAFHAAMAPLATNMIDNIAYDGTDVRKLVAEDLSKYVRRSKARVLDLCCGTGFSTRALGNAFPDAHAVIGMDTSSEMVAMARFITQHLNFVQPLWNRLKNFQDPHNYLPNRQHKLEQQLVCQLGPTYAMGNAESTPFEKESFDLVTIMYAFHETPKKGRDKILREAKRLLQPGGTLVVLDIASDYTPSESMLKGEPYVKEYQKNIHKQLHAQKGFVLKKYKQVVKNHVGMWVLKRSRLLAI